MLKVGRSKSGLANQSDISESTLRFNVIGCEPIEYEYAIKIVGGTKPN